MNRLIAGVAKAVLTGLWLVSGVVWSADNVIEEKACPNERDLKVLCGQISGMVNDRDESNYYSYSYQEIIYEASCADFVNDSEEEIARKVNLMWNKYEKNMHCNSPQFDVQGGSILKFAVQKKFSDFLYEAAQLWKVNLNKVDVQDGKNLLDYVQGEIARNRGNAYEPTLKQYYEVLREAGAKHRFELSNPECVDRGTPVPCEQAGR